MFVCTTNYVGDGTTHSSQFSPSFTWVLVTELRSSGNKHLPAEPSLFLKLNSENIAAITKKPVLS